MEPFNFLKKSLIYFSGAIHIITIKFWNVWDSFANLPNKLCFRVYSVCMTYTILMAKSHKRDLHIQIHAAQSYVGTVPLAYNLVCFSTLKIIPCRSPITFLMPRGIYLYSSLRKTWNMVPLENRRMFNTAVWEQGPVHPWTHLQCFSSCNTPSVKKIIAECKQCPL